MAPSQSREAAAQMAPALDSQAMTSDDVIEQVFAKLDPVALGVALGGVSGLTLFLTSATLLLKGGLHVGATLNLLGHFFIGFKTTWIGAVVGAVEAGIVGFGIGFLFAWCRNWCLAAYAYFARRWIEAKTQRDLLDKI
jgi:hypothetical protein